MRESSSGQELKIKEVDTRIEREIAELRTAIQASKVRSCFVLDWEVGRYKLTGVFFLLSSQAVTLQYLVGFGENHYNWMPMTYLMDPPQSPGVRPFSWPT